MVVWLDNLREILRINGVDDPKIIVEKCKCNDGNIDVRCTNHIIHNCIQSLKAKSSSEGSNKLVKLKKLGIVWDDYTKYCIEMQNIVEQELESEIRDDKTAIYEDFIAIVMIIIREFVLHIIFILTRPIGPSSHISNMIKAKNETR